LRAAEVPDSGKHRGSYLPLQFPYTAVRASATVVASKAPFRLQSPNPRGVDIATRRISLALALAAHQLLALQMLPTECRALEKRPALS
jgi:hypothetical protein